MIKIVAPNMALNVVDRAMQIHGAVGLSQDTPLAGFFAYARTLRLADGPDQVHMMQLGRNLAKKYE
jgi:acyl-CoA dehydrogenase